MIKWRIISSNGRRWTLRSWWYVPTLVFTIVGVTKLYREDLYCYSDRDKIWLNWSPYTDRSLVKMADLSNQQIQVIELKMMDKRKYYPLTVLSGFSIRCLLYPFTLIKTRLQVQKGRSIYNGTFDAFRKILQAEGAPGLYRGFMVNSIQVIPQLFYISTYEGTRQYLKHNTPITNNKIRSFIAGGSASIVGQTLLVPVDIVSQHIMMIGENQAPAKKGKIHVRSLAPLNIPTGPGMSRYGMTKAVTQAVYRRDGLLGFYKGYLASLAVYAPNSAMWWFFYDTYCGRYLYR